MQEPGIRPTSLYRRKGRKEPGRPYGSKPKKERRPSQNVAEQSRMIDRPRLGGGRQERQAELQGLSLSGVGYRPTTRPLRSTRHC